MNLDDLTSDQLRSIDPHSLEAALSRDGWSGTGLQAPAAVWESPQGFSVLIPHDQTFADYLPRLHDALRTLRLAYDDAFSAVLARALAPESDVLRFRADVDTPPDGSIAFQHGFRLLEGVRGAMEAASRAAEGERRPTYSNAGWKKARDYLSTARLGQTERGSYVVTVISRLSIEPSFGDVVDSGFDEAVGQAVPFQRKVNVALVEAVEAAREAAQEYTASSDFEVFEASVAKGVSAELCKSLATMLDAGLPVDIAVDPSSAIEWPESVARATTLPPSALSPLELAHARFREYPLAPDSRVVGSVDVLSRKDYETGVGIITLHNVQGVEASSVRVRLSSDDYELAIAAHRDKVQLEVRGDVIREGKLTWMYGPTQVRIVPD